MVLEEVIYDRYFKGRKCCRKKMSQKSQFFYDFKRNVAGIKCHENSKIKMLPEFKVGTAERKEKFVKN